MLQAEGGTNSVNEMSIKAANWLAEAWTDGDQKYDSDPEVKKAMKSLEKAKQRKNERERKKAAEKAAEEARYRNGMIEESRRNDNFR